VEINPEIKSATIFYFKESVYANFSLLHKSMIGGFTLSGAGSGRRRRETVIAPARPRCCRRTGLHLSIQRFSPGTGPNTVAVSGLCPKNDDAPNAVPGLFCPKA
jgi:hypothetical protein